MSKGDKQIEFKKGFSVYKKGAKATFSRDLATRLILRGVAKEVKQTKAEK